MLESPQIQQSTKLQHAVRGPFDEADVAIANVRLNLTPPEGIAKFDQMVSDKLLEVVYNANGDKIFHAIPGAVLPALQVGG